MNPNIDRIKKLLRLSKDNAATPAEAALALAKAMQIAQANGIDLSRVPTDEPGTGGITHSTEPSQAGIPHRLASRLVKRHFSVSTLFDSTGKKPVIHFIGIEENCQLASYCYVYLVRTMRTAWRTRTNRRLRDRESFLHGFAGAIDSAMPEIFHRPGLIFSADRYIEDVILAGKHGAKITTTKPGKSRLNPAAAFEGHLAGKTAGIRNAIRGSETQNID